MCGFRNDEGHAQRHVHDRGLLDRNTTVSLFEACEAPLWLKFPQFQSIRIRLKANLRARFALAVQCHL